MLYSGGVASSSRAHRAQGHTVAIASSATPYQVEPLARELGVDHVLCTRLEVVDGVLTGEVDGADAVGPGQGRAPSRAFAARERASTSTRASPTATATRT